MYSHAAVHPRIQQRIQEEKTALQARSIDDVLHLIASGKQSRALGHVLFFGSREQSEKLLAAAAESMRREDSIQVQMQYIDFFVKTCISLSSALVLHRFAEAADEQFLSTLSRLCREGIDSAAESAAGQLLAQYAREEAQRCVAEARGSEVAELRQAAVEQGSLAWYIESVIEEIQTSQLYQHACSSAEPGDTLWGNDNGAFLEFALWCGAVFQTTNPPLVKAAWDLAPDFWESAYNSFREQAASVSSPLNSLERDAALLTGTVVSRSCSIIRDLFLFLDGEAGFVCYQVNPRNHNQADAMVAEARYIFSVLEAWFDGGEPNVSFKLPGTSAGLETARILSAEGYSLTITLSFSMFQADAFAQVLKDSTAQVSSIVIMNGRLAFPVRDELVETCLENREACLEASQWAGVEVTRQLYRRLYGSEGSGGLGLDPRRLRIMNASLRIYDGEIPDIIEIWGSPSITIFPNVRHALNVKQRVFSPEAVKRTTDPQYVGLLQHSELFCQAWWYDGADDSGKPKHPIRLEDETAVTAWQPIADTLSQFLDAYEKTLQLVQELQKEE